MRQALTINALLLLLSCGLSCGSGAASVPAPALAAPSASTFMSGTFATEGRSAKIEVDVALYLDKATVGGNMNVGPDGEPAQNGTAQYEFAIHIPKSIKDGVPMGLVQNGHGLLGSKAEASNGQLAIFCNFAVDMIGMAHEDVDTVLKW